MSSKPKRTRRSHKLAKKQENAIIISSDGRVTRIENDVGPETFAMIPSEINDELNEPQNHDDGKKTNNTDAMLTSAFTGENIPEEEIDSDPKENEQNSSAAVSTSAFTEVGIAGKEKVKKDPTKTYSLEFKLKMVNQAKNSSNREVAR